MNKAAAVGEVVLAVSAGSLADAARTAMKATVSNVVLVVAFCRRPALLLPAVAARLGARATRVESG